MEEKRLAVSVRKMSPRLVSGYKMWLSEFAPIAKLEHPNLVSYQGVTPEKGEECLVSDFYYDGTLEKRIFGTFGLSWGRRVLIAKGLASGLAFLHSQNILHGFILPEAVLLDEDLNPKFAAHGLPFLEPSLHAQPDEAAKKWDESACFAHLDKAGYLDPTFKETGVWVQAHDMYSLGILLLELLTGVHCANTEGGTFLPWIRSYWSKRNPDLQNVVDARVKTSYKANTARKLLEVAKMCIEPPPPDRPSAVAVLESLKLLDSSK